MGGLTSCLYSEKQDPNNQIDASRIKKFKIPSIRKLNTDDEKVERYSHNNKINEHIEDCSYILTSANSGNELNYNVKYKKKRDSEGNLSNINMNINK